MCDKEPQTELSNGYQIDNNLYKTIDACKHPYTHENIKHSNTVPKK